MSWCVAVRRSVCKMVSCSVVVSNNISAKRNDVLHVVFSS
jgi:hypothetical protein